MLTLREKYITTVSNDIVTPSDVIILLEGDGFNRIGHAISLYQKGFASTILFSGGAENHQYGSFPFNEIKHKFQEASIPKNSIIVEENSQHTQAQAVEFIRLAELYDWKKAILVGSPDHQYRAYLTFLRQILDINPSIILMNSPAINLEWFGDCGWGAPIDRIELEFERIQKYSALGHLASFEEAINYQKWKEQQLKKQN